MFPPRVSESRSAGVFFIRCRRKNGGQPEVVFLLQGAILVPGGFKLTTCNYEKKVQRIFFLMSSLYFWSEDVDHQEYS